MRTYLKSKHAVFCFIAVALIGLGCLAISDDNSDAVVTVSDSGPFTFNVGDEIKILSNDPHSFSCGISGLYVSDNCIVGTINVGAGTYSIDFWKYNARGQPIGHVQTTITVNDPNAVVTYNAGIGLVSGSSVWSETVPKGTFASLPVASYSSGAYVFKGWATASGSTSVVSSYTATSSATLYAVWEQQTVQISAFSATVANGQSFSHVFTTTPSNANLSVSSSGITGASVSGKTLSGAVPENLAPGKYYVVLTASSSGYKTGTVTVTITVPVQIVPPIEYTISLGQAFSYEPVTNPSNSTITLTSVKLGGSAIANSGFSVVGRTITGTPASLGTYDIQFTAAASGYISTAKTVRVFVHDAPAGSEPPSIGSISAVQRADEPRTWDFVALGLQNVVNVEWIYNGSVFASSSNTAIHEFVTAGAYTVTAKVYGADGSAKTASKTILVQDAYHPELAWIGVQYTCVGTGAFSSGPAWLSSSTTTVDGTSYTVVSGTPTTTGTYTYSLGSVTKTVTVYQKENTAPYSEFEYTLSEDRRTITVTFTGTGASVVYYNYGDSAAMLTSGTHTYAVSEGYFTVRVLAVNNISERESSHLIAIGGIDDDKATISVEDLTDITVKQGESVVISLTLADGDMVSLKGPAAEFLDVVDGRIIGDTSAVDPGSYDLTVTVTHSNGTKSEGTLTVTVSEKDKDPPATFGFRAVIYLLAFILIVGLAIGLWATRDKRKKNKTHSGRHNGGYRR